MTLLSYVQDAFKMSSDRHQELLTAAEKKEAPEILLNVEVIEAKDLVPKDSNGLTDPFVTLYLASNAAHRYNTSVKTGTLNPIWEEHFALYVIATKLYTGCPTEKSTVFGFSNIKFTFKKSKNCRDLSCASPEYIY